jgi:hypothetical protein
VGSNTKNNKDFVLYIDKKVQGDHAEWNSSGNQAIKITPFNTPD